VNRRDVVSALFAVATLSGTRQARAQIDHTKPFRIATFPDVTPVTRDWIIDAMRELGWIEERDFLIVPSEFQIG
jgi:hypothetical protein